MTWKGKGTSGPRGTYGAFDSQVRCRASRRSELRRCTGVRRDTVEWSMFHSNSASSECTKSHVETLHTATDSFHSKLAVDPLRVGHLDRLLGGGSRSCQLSLAWHQQRQGHLDMSGQ